MDGRGMEDFRYKVFPHYVKDIPDLTFETCITD